MSIENTSTTGNNNNTSATSSSSIHKAYRKKYEIPLLRNIQAVEAQYIKSMYCMYDYNSTGSVPRHLCIKLFMQIGLDNTFGLPSCMSLKDVLLYIDQRLPDSDLQLESALYTFTRTAGTLSDDGHYFEFKPEKLVDYLASLDRNVPSVEEMDLLIQSMLEYDDVSEDTKVNALVLSRELTAFAKRNNQRAKF